MNKGRGRALPTADPPPACLCPLDKPPLNNAVVIAPSLGRPHGHGKRLPLASSLALPAPAYTAYATLKAGGECGGRVGQGGGRGGCAPWTPQMGQEEQGARRGARA